MLFFFFFLSYDTGYRSYLIQSYDREIDVVCEDIQLIAVQPNAMLLIGVLSEAMILVSEAMILKAVYL